MKTVPLDFDEWIEVNDSELNCYFAESGADRELDFDFERSTERIFFNSDPKLYPQFKYTKETNIMYMVVEITPQAQGTDIFSAMFAPKTENMQVMLAFPKFYNELYEAKDAIAETQESVNQIARDRIEKSKQHPTLYPVSEEMCEQGAVLSFRNFVIVPIEDFIPVKNDSSIHHENPTVKKGDTK